MSNTLDTKEILKGADQEVEFAKYRVNARLHSVYASVSALHDAVRGAEMVRPVKQVVPAPIHKTVETDKVIQPKIVEETVFDSAQDRALAAARENIALAREYVNEGDLSVSA